METIARGKFTADASRLVDVAKQRNAGGFVIGWPINMDGTAGPRAQATAAFVRNMGRLTSLPFLYWDERLTTVSAERSMLDADLSRAKRARNVDQVAAAIILQAAIDRLSHIALR